MQAHDFFKIIQLQLIRSEILRSGNDYENKTKLKKKKTQVK